ncbi:MAG TPA: hypothetical protein VE641_14620 [Chthoniobacterales bacterium]|jgi:hypothetical protein|nr:hypothetical protein [Chthoniobacterales bacterium]
MLKERSEEVVVGGKDFQIEVYVTDDGLNRIVRISRNGKPVGPGYNVPVEKEPDIEKQHLVDAIEEVIKAAKQSIANLPAEELEKL